MADSKLLHPDTYSDPRLMKCGICVAVVDKPKLLPCLHTFCLKCLSSWHESFVEKNPSQSATMISCPTCCQQCSLPEGGVKDITPNYFVNKLKERDTLRQQLQNGDDISCTSCDESEAISLTWCMDCNDFLCEKCTDTHKSLRKFKRDRVFSLDQLRADSMIVDKSPEEERCTKHPEEVLKFYCETCEEPMCRDCIVVEHPSPDHKQADIKTIIPTRTAELENLYKQSRDIPDAIDEVLKLDDEKIVDLETNMKKAIKLYRKTAAKAEAEFLQSIHQLEADRRMMIENHKETLKCHKSRVCSGLELTKQVSEIGTMYDIGMMFAPLSNAMSNADVIRPKLLDNHVSKLGFVPMEDLSKSLGVLNNYKQWTLFNTIESIEFNSPKGIAYNNNGEIMVADSSDLIMIGSNRLVKKTLSTKFDELLNSDDNSQSKPKSTVRIKFEELLNSDDNSQSKPKNSVRPSAVVSAGYDSWYVTDESNFLKLLDDQGNLKNKIEISSAQIKVIPQLRGLARDNQDRLYIGTLDGKVSGIRIYSESGTWLTRFDICSIYPDFIAVTPEDHVIISGFNTDDSPRVQRQPNIYLYLKVEDEEEESERICYDADPYQFPAPTDVAAGNFYPTGVCLHTGHKLIFVACYGETPGIYCYSYDGKYIGIVTKEVTAPQGIALTDLEETLAVCDGNKVKLFHCC